MEELQNNQETKDYEISFLGTSEEISQKISSTLSELGADVYFTNPARQITLSYLIEKHPSAFFGHCHFKLDPSKLSQLREKIAFDKDVVRFLIISPPIKKIIEKQKPETSSQISRTESEINDSAKTLIKKEESKDKPEVLSNELLEKKLEEILK